MVRVEARVNASLKLRVCVLRQYFQILHLDPNDYASAHCS